MSTSPPEPPQGHGPGEQPSFAAENAMRVASETLSSYDAEADVYHCSYGPPIPALTVRDPERELLVRVDPQTSQVVGFSIPDFRSWHARNAEPDGTFEVDLPPTWPLRPGEAGADPEN